MSEFTFGKAPKIAGGNVSAAVIAAEILAIEEEHGEATAKLYVERARSPDSPLHPTLPWNDAEAAEDRRLDIARRIIRVIRVKRVDTVGTTREVRAFLRVVREERSVFVNLDRVEKNEQWQRDQLTQMHRELRQVVAKYNELSALFPDVFGAIERAIGALARDADVDELAEAAE